MRASREINDITLVFVCNDYALETLINGNYAECARYLTELLTCSKAGLEEYTESIIKIYNHSKNDYEIIIDLMKY